MSLNSNQTMRIKFRFDFIRLHSQRDLLCRCFILLRRPWRELSGSIGVNRGKPATKMFIYLFYPHYSFFLFILLFFCRCKCPDSSVNTTRTSSGWLNSCNLKESRWSLDYSETFVTRCLYSGIFQKKTKKDFSFWLDVYVFGIIIISKGTRQQVLRRKIKSFFKYSYNAIAVMAHDKWFNGIILRHTENVKQITQYHLSVVHGFVLRLHVLLADRNVDKYKHNCLYFWFLFTSWIAPKNPSSKALPDY